MSLSGKARLAGVMGWPVGHSRSPSLHGHWFERYGIDGTYVPLPVRPEDVADCVVFAVTRPRHVNIDEIVIKALAQTSGARILRH